MHPERSGQPDLSAGPGGERGGDPIMQLRLGADFPRQKGDAQEKEPDEAEQKPLPRQLARLHTDLSTRSGAAGRRPRQSNRHKARLFIARLAPRGEPNSRIFLGYQEMRNANSAGVPDPGNRAGEAPGRLPAMIPWSSNTGAKLTATMVSPDSPASS